MTGRATESFSRLPWRITLALRSDELTRDEYLLLVYLTARITHDQFHEQLPPDGWLVTELAVLKAETDWPKTLKRLAQVLESLVAKGWIERTTRAGSKKWRIRLTGAAVAEEGGKIAETDALDFQLSSKQDDLDPSTDPLGQQEAVASEPGNTPDSLEVEVDVEVEKGQGSLGEEGRENGEVAGSWATGETLLPEVREAVNRTRADRGEPPLREHEPPQLLRPLVGEPGYFDFSRTAYKAGHITFDEHLANTRAHRLVRDALTPPMGEAGFIAALKDAFDATTHTDEADHE